jgi:hypothetical protein
MCSSSPETNVECKVSLIYDILLGYTQNQFKEDREKIEKEACYFSISYIRHTITKKTLEGYISVNMLEETKGELLNIEARSFELHKTIFNDTLTLPLYPTEAIHTIYIK